MKIDFSLFMEDGGGMAAADLPKVAAEVAAETTKKPDDEITPDLPVDRINPQMALTCKTCQHFTRPGLSAGYSGGRDDLPLAYGKNHPLRRLPDDHGASCAKWKEQE